MIAGFLVACVLATSAGCGDSESDSEDATADTVVSETTAPPAKLPRGWTTTVNESGGYSIGVPPGWSEKRSAAKTTLKSPGSAVVVSVTADRSDEALEADLSEYAESIAAKLAPASKPRGTGEGPEGPPTRDPGYESASTYARVPGKLLNVVVVRRIGLAAYPVLVAADIGAIKGDPSELGKIIRQFVLSLRGRPVTVEG
jgi:hypothetical protein